MKEIMIDLKIIFYDKLLLRFFIAYLISRLVIPIMYLIICDKELLSNLFELKVFCGLLLSRILLYFTSFIASYKFISYVFLFYNLYILLTISIK